MTPCHRGSLGQGLNLDVAGSVAKDPQGQWSS